MLIWNNWFTERRRIDSVQYYNEHSAIKVSKAAIENNLFTTNVKENIHKFGFSLTLTSLKDIMEKPKLLMVVPIFHAYGLLVTIGSVVCGAEVVLLRKFEERSFLNAIQTYKTNIGAMVPPLLLFLANSPLVDSYDLSSLIIIGCGAAPLSKKIYDAVTNRLSTILFLGQGYGMTEMTLSALTQTPIRMKPGSVGVLQPGTWG